MLANKVFINKNLQNKTSAKFPTAADALEQMPHGIASYLAFVNGNTDMVDAGLGKNNEDNIKGVGKALALYAKWGKQTDDFSETSNCNSLLEIKSNSKAKNEVFNNAFLIDYLINNSYANGQLFDLLGTKTQYSGNYDIPTVATVDIVITDEMLATGVMFADYSLAIKTSYSSNFIVYAQLNDVDIVRLSSKSVTSLAEKKQILLSDYNITSAGTYTLKCVASGPPYDRYPTTASSITISMYNF